jgi:undecaprenyl pyrophosphate phosphatase UppP
LPLVARLWHERTMECYVCHEPTTHASECVCKASVHPRCLLKCVALSRSTKCTICHQPITNVQRKETRRYSCLVGTFAIALFSAALVCALGSLLLIALAAEEKREDVFYDLIVCCATSVCMAMVCSRFLQRLLEGHDLILVHEQYSFT